jgi:DNA-binding response OmpR family regulator
VLDIHLPDINGLVLANKLRDRLGAEIPIIIVSGDTSMETIKSLSHVGATYFFSKPVNPNVLVQRLKELVGGA